MKSRWITYTKNDIKPGKHKFYWIYTKWNDGSSMSMRAELEYLKITGLSYAAKECITCKKGSSEAGSSRCSLCAANYFSDNSGAETKCTKCPTGYFSYEGSVGKESCLM